MFSNFAVLALLIGSLGCAAKTVTPPPPPPPPVMNGQTAKQQITITVVNQ
jgi:hypothetical protein